MKKYARKDDNHDAIVDLFVSAGLSVLLTHQLGGGAPDIIVGGFGVNVLVEIKDGSKPPSKRRLTPDELKFMQTWKGWYEVVESTEDARVVAARMAKGRPGNAAAR